MPKAARIFALLAPAFFAALAMAQTDVQVFRSHNQQMAALQPPAVTPIVASDPRLIQFARFSVSREFTAAATETVNFGNGKGAGIILERRFELDWIPPTYIVHNSAAKDGAGDTGALLKYRIASGNAEHANFEVTGIVSHTFATGSHSNGAATDSFTPTLATAVARKKFTLISTAGGLLPVGKVNAQGRTIAWNEVAQVHPLRNVWFEVENNATYYYAGEHDGKMQNFVLPGAFYIVRRKNWTAMHPYFIVDAGMQIATSGFHTYNHNLVTETRVLF